MAQGFANEINGRLIDRYSISEIDDVGAHPHYYGFTGKGGEWYIMEENSGSYRYFSGASNFATGWTNRASHSYDYYENIF